MATDHTGLTGSQVLEFVRRERSGFLVDADVAAIAADPATRLELLLVRCGGCRFLAPADQVAHLLRIIVREGSDYVRDVSLPAGRWLREAGR